MGSAMLKTKREDIVLYLKTLRDKIIREFESLEPNGARFTRKTWPYQKGDGGGEMAIVRGEAFEKAAVNWSGVGGPHFPGTKDGPPFFATGVSLITHMTNPKAPTAHFNIRYIESGDKIWLGGGFDLTPMGFEFPEDTQHFHNEAKKSLNSFGAEIYPRFMQNAKEYFTIKHYNRERGVGGIFFDHYNTGDLEKDLALWRSVGDHFLDAIMPIYKRRLNEAYTEADKKIQLQRRAHYVEFNLLYDRGTKFGLMTGGNIEAILMSLPPIAKWD